MPALNKIRFQGKICPSVIEITFVGMYAEKRSPACVFNHRQRSQRARPPSLSFSFAGAFQQARVGG